MKSLLFFVLAISVVILSFATGENSEEFVCKREVLYEENECNRCSCTLDSKLSCTRRACPWNDSKDLNKCTVGTKWQKECNTCWCINKTGTICTVDECNKQ